MTLPTMVTGAHVEAVEGEMAIDVSISLSSFVGDSDSNAMDVL